MCMLNAMNDYSGSGFKLSPKETTYDVTEHGIVTILEAGILYYTILFTVSTGEVKSPCTFIKSLILTHY